MNVLSISIDAAIADRESEAYRRQARYADHFDQLTVLTKTEDSSGEFADDSLEVIPLDTSSRLRFLYLAYRKGVQLCRERDFDVITVQSPFATETIGWALSKQFDIPLHVSTVIDVPNEAWREESWEHRLYTPVIRFVLKRADSVRVDTELGKWKVRQLVGPDVPITVVPVHMDLDRIDYQGQNGDSDYLREELDIGDRPVVLFAGRFVYQKNLEQWMEVAEKVLESTDTDPVFVLVGDGPKRGWVAERIRNKDMTDNFRLPGWVSVEELGALYDMSDIFLITSRYEGACRVIIEAGINELPVVSTPFAGARDNIVDSETGYREIGTNDLARRVTTLLESQEHRKTLGQNAREFLIKQTEVTDLVDRYIGSIRDSTSAII